MVAPEKIDRRELLRYLGHRGQAVGADLEKRIEAACLECARLSVPRHLYRVFPVAWKAEGAALEGTELILPGRDIRAHLEQASACAVMAVTLGSPLEEAIRRYEHTDLLGSMLLDAAATALVETVCDDVEGLVREEAAEKGLYAGSRFSPGYGDLPLELQPKLLGVLEAGKRIGLTCSPTLIMLPRKSVTAVIGLSSQRGKAGAKGSCSGCSLRESCPYRGSKSSCDRNGGGAKA